MPTAPDDDPITLTCHDCGVPEGALHTFGCDNEDCPFCGGQLIGCGCIYERLDLDCEPGTEIYEHGPTDEQLRVWQELLTLKGRIPFILYPYFCARCGEVFPDMFHVPDSEWAYYIQPDQRESIVCRPCYDEIKALIDKNSGRIPPKFVETNPFFLAPPPPDNPGMN